MSLRHREKNEFDPESVLLKILGILMALLCYIQHLISVKKERLSEFLYESTVLLPSVTAVLLCFPAYFRCWNFRQNGGN